MCDVAATTTTTKRLFESAQGSLLDIDACPVGDRFRHRRWRYHPGSDWPLGLRTAVSPRGLYHSVKPVRSPFKLFDGNQSTYLAKHSPQVPAPPPIALSIARLVRPVILLHRINNRPPA